MTKAQVRGSGLSKSQTRTALQRWLWNVGLRGIFDTVCMPTTMIFTAFALALGVKPEQMGWLVTIAGIAAILQIFSIPFISWVKDKKRSILRVGSVEPLTLLIAVAVLPVFSGESRLILLVVIIFITSAFRDLCRPLTEEWMASTIPGSLRNRFVGRRLQTTSIAILVSTLACGYLLEYLKGGEKIAGNLVIPLAIVIGAAAVFGLLAVLSLRGATMPAVSASAGVKLNALPNVVKNKAFLRLLLFIFIFNLPFFFACPYYQVFHLEVAEMPPSHVSYLATGYLLVKILLLPILTKVSESLGKRRSLYLCGILYSLFFSSYVIIRPDFYWPLFVAWGFVAAADGIYGVVEPVVLYGAIPDTPERVAYFTAYNVVRFTLFSAGGAIAVPLLEKVKAMGGLTVCGHSLSNFHLLYAACTIGILLCLCAARLLPKR